MSQTGVCLKFEWKTTSYLNSTQSLSISADKGAIISSILVLSCQYSVYYLMLSIHSQRSFWWSFSEVADLKNKPRIIKLLSNNSMPFRYEGEAIEPTFLMYVYESWEFWYECDEPRVLFAVIMFKLWKCLVQLYAILRAWVILLIISSEMF